MYVATNRQKPKNAFAERAEMQRKAEEKAKPASRATPTPVAEPKPDIEAMKAAAAEAAALIHVGDTETMTADFEAETEYALADPERAADLRDVVTETEPEPEPEPKRGRPMSAAVMKRNATILQLLAENPEGLSKPQLASELKEKEANVYSSLRKLQSDGKVRTENTEGTKYLWYLV